MNNKVGIILTARTKSSRFPKKILQSLGDKTFIQRGVDNLLQSGLPVVVSVPHDEEELAISLVGPVIYISSPEKAEDVLGRIIDVAEMSGFEHIVRVTHDDCVFCDLDLMQAMIDWHLKNNADYTGCPEAPRGIDCEIMSVAALKLAAEHTKHLAHREHITYYIKRSPFKWQEFPYQFRVAFDYPEDWEVIKKAWTYQSEASIVIPSLRNFFLYHPEIMLSNQLPRVSIYIVCHNYGRYLQRAIESVLSQTAKDKIELIICDDASTDNTPAIMNLYKNHAKIISNINNLGLTTTSNKAVKECRGEYILRLDADDWLEPEAIAVMLGYLEQSPGKAMVYSDYNEVWHEGKTIIKKSSIDLPLPHPACCLIRRNAWNNIRYDESLTCRDGIDFYIRFKQSFEVGYLPMPLWNYRRHDGSLSGKAEALKVERGIISKHLEKCFV